MRTTHLISIIVLSVFLFSCKNKEKTEKKSIAQKVEIFEPDVDPNEIEANSINWWTYHTNNISLSSPFIGLNQQSETIGKSEFLEKLITGSFIPLKLQSDTEDNIYKLFNLSSNAHESIGSTIKNESLTILKHYKMEGLPFREFNFTDLNGNIFNNENTKGKIIILKTWFIRCQACVAEFPELNDFVEKYKQRDDVIFLSLALETKTELENFLQKKDFKYQTVANQRDFIVNKLNLQIYPTHIIINKNGTIMKVVNKASEMIAYFENGKY